MAKELPYFRFTAQEWQNGDISLESYEIKGLFIDICAYYWLKDCSLTLAMLQKKFSNDKEHVNSLVDLCIIDWNDATDYIQINFLNEQYDMLSEKRTKRQKAGRSGGLKKSSNAKAMLKQKPSYKDKDKDNNKDKDKSIPTLKDFRKYALEKKPDVSIESVNLKYDSWITNNWKDGNNKKIVNWKSKLLNTLPHLNTVKKDNNPKYELI